ncbi:MAG: hypothetical protein H6835_04255 [Planctomycetes bacterium]|nr:hypothetical protein [Planctomycetota bacterium]
MNNVTAAGLRVAVSRGRGVSGLLLLLLCVGMVCGAQALSFLCDDAFITFRYVSNARDGAGLVWNPAPFAPVEGCSSFLWASLLWAVWSWSGIEPPDAANVLSMAFGVLQFAIIAFAAMRLKHRDGRPVGAVIWLAVLLAVVTNRTFLQWQTSGLETALFNACFLGWVISGLCVDGAPHRTRAWVVWHTCALLAELTRPDGLLLVAATCCCAVMAGVTRRASWSRLLTGALPVLVVVAQLVLRRIYYSEWLPNTYYAKVLAPWPEAGWRYLQCYAFEHGVWLWLPFGLFGAVAATRAVWRGGAHVVFARLASATVVIATLAHVAYYVVKVGGDHFEYRVFSQLGPLCALSAVAVVARATSRAAWATATALALALSNAPGWLLLGWTAEQARPGFYPIVDKVPGSLQPLARWYERNQGWLQEHLICLRASQHASFYRGMAISLPERRRLDLSTGDVPVLAMSSVGVAGWCLPDVAIIDVHGLNDRVVARTPLAPAPEALSPVRVRQCIVAADADGDGWLTAVELAAGMGAVLGVPPPPPGDHGVRMLLDIGATERRDALRIEEALTLLDGRFRRGGMAHERLPPPGYVEAFSPNVVLEAGRMSVGRREEPLTALRVRQIEAAWWQWVQEGADIEAVPRMR